MPYYRLIFILLFIFNSTALLAESTVSSAIIIRWNHQILPTNVVTLADGKKLNQSIVIHQENTLLTKVTVKPAESLIKLLKSIRALPGVIYAEPDYPVRMNQTPDDSFLDDQWYLSAVNVFNAWDLGTDCSDVIIVTVDTGIDLDHTELVNNLWVNPFEIADNGFDDDGNGIIDDVHGYNAFKNNGNPDDDNGHGTHVSGVIAASANNTDGIAGLCWSAQLMAIKFLDRFGGGSVSDAVRGIQYAIDNKPLNTPMIINNSWVIGQYSQALEDVLKLAEEQNILVTAAAGNTGADNDIAVVFPTYFRKQFDNIISVANVDQQNNLYVGSKGSSNFGVTNVDIAAPGTDIYSTFKGGAYQSLTGTSMATPVVSGAAALALQQSPDLSSQQLKAAILASASEVESLKGKLVIPGVIDIQQLVENIYDIPHVIYRYQSETADSILSGENIEITGFGLEDTLEVILGNQSVEFEIIDTKKIIAYLPPNAKDALLRTDSSNSLFLKVAIEHPSHISIKLIEQSLANWNSRDNSDFVEVDSNLLQEQPLLSWNNRSNAEFVEIERADGDSAYQNITSISSPQSIFQDTQADSLTACYRLRSGFEYIDPYTQEVKTRLSDYSSSTSIYATSEAVHWSTQTIGSVVKGVLFSEQLYARSLGGDFDISTTRILPAGFGLTSTGYLTGVPEQAGELRFDILLTADDGCPEQKNIVLTVTELIEVRYLTSQFKGLYNLQTDQGVITRLQSRDLFSWEEIPQINNYEVIDLSIDISPAVGGAGSEVLLTMNNDSFDSEDDFSLFVMDRFDDWVELTATDGVQKTAVGFNWVIEDNELFDHEVDRDIIHLKIAISIKQQAVVQNTDDNRCFIASVLYTEDIDEKKLKAFRMFRDDFLGRTILGRMVTDIYYSVSPEMAWWLLQRPDFSKVTRLCLNFLYLIFSIVEYFWLQIVGCILFMVMLFLNRNYGMSAVKK